MPYLVVRGQATGAELLRCEQVNGFDLARQDAMRLLVEKLRPYIKVTNLPRTGDDYKVKVEIENR